MAREPASMPAQIMVVSVVLRFLRVPRFLSGVRVALSLRLRVLRFRERAGEVVTSGAGTGDACGKC